MVKLFEQTSGFLGDLNVVECDFRQCGYRIELR